jgi:hypothetical protein
MPEKDHDEVYDSDEKDSGTNTGYTSEDDLLEGFPNNNGRPQSSRHDTGCSSIDFTSSVETDCASHENSDLNGSFTNGYSDPNSDSDQPAYFKSAETPIDYPKPVVKIYPYVRGIEVLSPERSDKFEFMMETTEDGYEPFNRAQLEFEEDSAKSRGTVGGILKELYDRHAKLRSSVGLPQDTLIGPNQDCNGAAPYVGDLDSLVSRPAADPTKPNPYALLAQYRRRRYSGSDIPDCTQLTTVEFASDNSCEQNDDDCDSDPATNQYHPMFSQDDLAKRPNQFGGARVEDLLEKYSHRNPRPRSSSICDIKPIMYTGDADKVRQERATGQWLPQSNYKPFITRSLLPENRPQRPTQRNERQNERQANPREVTRARLRESAMTPQSEDDNVFEPLEGSTGHQSGTTTPKFSYISKILETSPKGEALSKYLASRFAEQESPPELRPPSPTTLMHQEAEAILDRHKNSTFSAPVEPASPIQSAIEDNPLLKKYRSLSDGKTSPGSNSVATGRMTIRSRSRERVDPSNINGHLDSTTSASSRSSDTDGDAYSFGGATSAERMSNNYSNSEPTGYANSEPTGYASSSARTNLSRGRSESVNYHSESHESRSLGNRSVSIGSRSESLGSSNSLKSHLEHLGNRSESLRNRPESLGNCSDSPGNRLESLGHRSELLGHRSELLGHRSELLGHRSESLGRRSKSLGRCSESFGSPSDSSVGSYSTGNRHQSRLGSFSDRFSYRRSSTNEDDLQSFSDSSRMTPRSNYTRDSDRVFNSERRPRASSDYHSVVDIGDV